MSWLSPTKANNDGQLGYGQLKEKNNGNAKNQGMYRGLSETRFEPIGAERLSGEKSKSRSGHYKIRRRLLVATSCRRANRKRLTGDFLIDVRKMSESGDTIIAMAVALE